MWTFQKSNSSGILFNSEYWYVKQASAWTKIMKLQYYHPCLFIYHECVLRRSCFNDAIYPRVNDLCVCTVCAHHFVIVLTHIFIICASVSGDLLHKNRVTPYLVRICVYCILHKHHSPNYQWPPFLLCYVWLEMQPAKRIMIAEVMPSTCAQLSIQSDLWFAYQIWFLDNVTMLFPTTHYKFLYCLAS